MFEENSYSNNNQFPDSTYDIFVLGFRASTDCQ